MMKSKFPKLSYYRIICGNVLSCSELREGNLMRRGVQNKGLSETVLNQ